MVNASLRGVSLSEAEQALVTVWCRVEEYGIDAPQLHFDFQRDGSVTIRLSFPDPATAFLVLNGLDAWEPGASNGTAAPIPARRKPRRRVAVGAEGWCALRGGD
jgi:hypothetical protein